MPSIRNKNIKLIELDTLLKTARNQRKIVFGTKKKAKIEFDRKDTDYLIISGSSAGLVLSGSNIVFDGAANFPFLKFEDDEKLYFGTDNDAFIEHTAGGDGFFKIDASDSEEIFIIAPDDKGEAITLGVSGDSYIVIKTTDGSESITLKKDTFMPNNKKLYFGHAITGFGSIENNNDGDGFLIVSGASEGLALSGSNIHITGSSLININSMSNLLLSGSNIYVSGSVSVNRKAGANSGHGLLYSPNGNCLRAGVLGKHQGFLLTHTGSTPPYGPNDSIIDLRAANDGDADAGDAAGHISVNTGSGEIVKWYDAIGALNTAGPGTPCVLDHQNWRKADANVSSGTNNSQKLMGIYLGDDFVLLRGWFKMATGRMDNQPSSLSSDPGGGSPVYLGGSNTGSSCVYDMLPPSGSGDVVRIIGHLVDEDSDGYLIYFNPSNDWVKVSS